MSGKIALALVLVLALVGCGDEDDEGDGGDGAAQPAAVVDLEIEFTEEDALARKATVRCDRNRHRATAWLADEPSEACEEALRLRDFLVSKPEPQRICTQIYGGSQRARITGTISGATVQRRFSRENGCEIADYDRVAELLPGPGGVR